MIEFEKFALEQLLPAANNIIAEKYDAYCNDIDIHIEIKKDSSPASDADRLAEKAIRELINKTYPDHGIWGEEYGGENLTAEYVWVLDPLDGTRQFLNKQTGYFVVLVGLMKNQIPILGFSSDPISREIWYGQEKADQNKIDITEATITSTAPDRMFDNSQFQQNIKKLLASAKMVKTDLNAKSFLSLIDGSADIAIESSLGLHDIAALIPILEKAGCSVCDFEGQSYINRKFNFDENKYDFLVTSNQNMMDEVLNVFKG